MFGAALLLLALIGVISSLHLGSQRGRTWDEMSKRQRAALMQERVRDNPALLKRR